jgi:site-specific recombinase XerD
VFFGAKRFHLHLFQTGICEDNPTPKVRIIEQPALIISFREWFQKHRGATEPTLRQYSRGASQMLQGLGEDVGQWNARQVRAFLLDRVKECGDNTAEKLITAMRAFLRYLSFRGLCRIDLDRSVPTLAHWRLATMPQSLTSEEVDRLVAACDGSSTRCLRDRAMVLLLVRLGLRAGDVAQLRLTDIEWESGTLRVLGKGRYEVRLPLPQDVGDALSCYLERRPKVGQTDRVFVRNIAPFRPSVSNDCVSGVVKRALRRARIVTTAKGAHLLRHTAATQMLRQGVPLDQIGLVLRHRGIDTTAYYAKVDVGLLKQIAQPWPEVES